MKKIVLFCLTTLLSVSAWAFDADNGESVILSYNIVAADGYDYACEVTYSTNNYSYEEINIPETAYNESDGNTYTVVGVDEWAFADAWDLSSITLPSTLLYIEDGAFCDAGLTSVTIPGSIVDFGESVFASCWALEEVIIEEGVTNIGYEMFNLCSVLTKVSLPSSLTSIGDYAFQYCFELKEIELPSKLVSIGDYAFSTCSLLEKINIPGTVANLGVYIFNECKSLNNVTLEEGLPYISNRMFYSCESLTSINLPSTLTSIGEHAFGCCSLLEEVTIPNKVTTIGQYAFEMCYVLSSVVIGSSVTSIANWAFYYEHSGITFTILNPTPPTPGGTSVFNSDNATIYVPAGTLAEYKRVWGTLSGISTYNELDYIVLKITLADNSGVGYATYYNEDYDVTIPEGINAYWAESVEDGVVTLTEITGSIPAKTAVVLKGDLTDIAEANASSSTRTNEYSENLLHGQSLTETLLEEENGDYLYYMLTTNMDGENLGFYWGAIDGSAFVSKANKAWLAVPAGQSNALSIKFKDKDETTGITSVETEVDATTVSGIYTLQGVRVSDMNQKGVYIVNGKKVLVK